MHPPLPRISLVTPSSKNAQVIEQTIRSVLDQEYVDLEYIVIDGAGGDGTEEILRRYAGGLAYWSSEPDSGQYDAINKGFARATGEVFGWLNADDKLLPRALWVVGQAFARFGDVDWISTRKPAVWDADGNLRDFSVTPGFSKEAFLDGLYLPGTLAKGYWIQQESTFWRRSLWEKVGCAIPDVSLAGDFSLW